MTNNLKQILNILNNWMLNTPFYQLIIVIGLSAVAMLGIALALALLFS